MRPLLLAAAIVLAGCGLEGAPEAGEVIAHRHIASTWHWHDTSYTQCFSYDSKTGACTMSVQVPDGHDHFHPDRWEIRIRECRERKGPNCREGWVNLGSIDDGGREEQARYPLGVNYPEGRKAR